MRYYASAGLKTLSLFLVLPIAAYWLPKTEVGQFFFWLAVIQLGAGVTTLGFSSTVARKAYSGRAIDYTAGTGVVVAVLAWILVSTVGLALGVIGIAVVLAWISRSISMVSESRIIAHGEVTKLSWVYIAYAVLFPLLCWVFASKSSATHSSLLFAYAISEGLIACSGMAKIRLHRRLKFMAGLRSLLTATRRSANYGLPIMIAGIANLGLNSVDRFVVTGLIGFDAVAEFSMMYTIAFASNRFITAPANMRIFPEYVRGRHGDDVAGRVFVVSNLAWFASIAYCVVLALIGPVVISRVLGEMYAIERMDLVLVAGASSMFLLFTFNSAHLKIGNNTRQIMFLLFAALAINLCMSLLLVPKFGYRGASISTFIAYSSLAAWAVFRLRPSFVSYRSLVAGVAILLALISVVASL